MTRRRAERAACRDLGRAAASCAIVRGEEAELAPKSAGFGKGRRQGESSTTLHKSEGALSPSCACSVESIAPLSTLSATRTQPSSSATLQSWHLTPNSSPPSQLRAPSSAHSRRKRQTPPTLTARSRRFRDSRVSWGEVHLGQLMLARAARPRRRPSLRSRLPRCVPCWGILLELS